MALDAKRIQAALPPEVAMALAGVHVFAELDSTNRWAWQEGQCGTVCLAEAQTAGRGRRGRVWQSPAGVNLYLSLRWCFAVAPPHVPWLGLRVAVAVAEGLAAAGVQGHSIKWPNDLVFMDATGKLAKFGGILLEGAGDGRQVVLGIGLNVNLAADGLADVGQAWASLYLATGRQWERNHVVANLLAALVPALQAFPHEGKTSLSARWQPWDALAGKTVQVAAPNGIYNGQTCGLADDGQLQIRLADGTIKAFTVAEVSVRLA